MNRKGFTTLELIIGIGLIAIIAAVGLARYNPLSYLEKADNNERRAEVNSIITAVGRRIADKKGKFETGCTAGVIPSTPTYMGSGAGNYDIEPCLVPAYLQQMPLDPDGGTTADTKYQISQDENGRVTVSAPQAELGETISVTR